MRKMGVRHPHHLHHPGRPSPPRVPKNSLATGDGDVTPTDTITIPPAIDSLSPLDRRRQQRHRLASGGEEQRRGVGLGAAMIVDDYRLKKISTEMEVEQLRSMLHDLDRKRLLRAPPSGLRESVSASISG